MLVDVHKRNRTSSLECAEHRDRDRMVAAEHDRQGTGFENFAYGLFGATQVAFHVEDVGAHVTAVHRADMRPS